jgi:hypothetical protein
MKQLTKLVLMSALVVGGNRASEAAEWVAYNGEVPSNAVYSTHDDLGVIQEGWPVCRYRKTVGWFDTDSNECHTMGQRVVAQRSAYIYMLVQPAGDGMLLHSATENMVIEPGWIPYQNDDSAAAADFSGGDLVTTDNYDRGGKQEGWTVCRWRKSVGYVDERGFCKSVNNKQEVIEHKRDFYVYQSASDSNVSLPAAGRGTEWFSLSDYMGESADSLNDNTASFERAFRAMADSSVYKLFVPAGHYRIQEESELPNTLTQGISLYGSSRGISLIAPFTEGTPAGNVLIFDNHDHSLSFYGLYFQNVKFRVDRQCTDDKAEYENNVFINHGTLYATGGIISESAGCQSRIRGNIFLGSSLPSGTEGRPAYGHSPTIKTVASSIHVVENVFGLDMDDLAWLAGEWGESDNWTNITHKLGYLKYTLGLPSDMGKFFCVLNSGGYYTDHEIIFERNIVNASPGTVGYPDGTDHVLYLKGPDDARIVGNYFRGFKEDYVKFSGARNSVVAFNNFDGPGLALYIENCRSDREGSGKLNELSNLLIYKNQLSLNDDEQLRDTNFYTYNYCTGSRTSFNGGWGDYADHRFSVLPDPVVEEDMIEYAYNSKAGSQEVGIYLKANNSFPEAHLMYENNVDIESSVMGEISLTSEKSEFFMPDYADWLNTDQLHPELSLPSR